LMFLDVIIIWITRTMLANGGNKVKTTPLVSCVVGRQQNLVLNGLRCLRVGRLLSGQ
jgi:hypothetical protein